MPENMESSDFKEEAVPQEDVGGEIECPLGAWYYRRMGLMFLLLGVFAAWFAYDGLVKWPKLNEQAIAKMAFGVAQDGGSWSDVEEHEDYIDMAPDDATRQLIKSAFQEGGSTMPWADFAREQKLESLLPPPESAPEFAWYEAFRAGAAQDGTWPNYATRKNIDPEGMDETVVNLKKAFVEGSAKRKWDGFAAEHGLRAGKDLKYYPKSDLREQIYIGSACGVGALVVVVLLVLNLGKKMRADGDSITMPNGTRIPFAAVKKIDKVKWDRKGLAYLEYEADGESKKAVLDELKFPGTQRIFDRLMANFSGALVDVERIESSAEEPENGSEEGA
ncbi:MAG: hypothetical protein AAGA58_15330 [Verrucomicrobiota bacterium]